MAVFLGVHEVKIYLIFNKSKTIVGGRGKQVLGRITLNNGKIMDSRR
jgi:hypothetical protein